MSEFNLLDEKWIAVRKGAQIEELSLKEVLAKAHEIDGLAGELPTQDAAILRLLLAVLYASLAREERAYSDAIEFWKGLYEEAKRFPMAEIEGYLEGYRDRFWLFDDEKPFLQVAGLQTADGKINPIAQIVADVPSREERRFFSTMNGAAVQSISFAEAARWLVDLQAWDYAGKKASVVGGAPNGGGTGWCGKLGLIYPRGKNLFQTLMLNFVLLNSSGAGEPLPFAPPAWEQPPRTAAKLELRPKSYVELLTWQSRRARLFAENGRATGIISSYGDVFEKGNTFIEQMSGWHQSSIAKQGFIPKTHDSTRQIWRDLGALLPLKGDTSKETRRPPVLAWLNELKIRGTIPLVAVGYEYGPMQGVVDTMISDSLHINAELLGHLDDDWAQRIVDVLVQTDRGVYALGRFANDLDKAAGGDGKSAGDLPKLQAYAALDEPFRDWLARISPQEDDIEEKMIKWRATARKELLKRGTALAAEAGSAAFVGRKDKNGRLVNTPIAHRWFFGEISKHLGKGG
ncbi:MAG: type I-E CRISPR-associated protein Cse1/CasA [Christensenellaceae bacterium]|jgi:CRISPR system Cascade subunit CasA|nr:type I-E CRISPR-associated protein Cse1/CasA [Christensenellaceae bacterium]